MLSMAGLIPHLPRENLRSSTSSSTSVIFFFYISRMILRGSPCYPWLLGNSAIRSVVWGGEVQHCFEVIVSQEF